MNANASIEDIIFIVLGFIWVVYSAYKSGKTSKKGGVDDEETKGGSSNFAEDLLEKYFGVSDVERGTKVEDVETVIERSNDGRQRVDIGFSVDNVNEDANLFSYDDYYENKKYGDIKDKVDLVDEEKVSNNEMEKEKKVSFNLRKAFIYSEIIRRKYI
jgi:hypothetical protein